MGVKGKMVVLNFTGPICFVSNEQWMDISSAEVRLPIITFPSDYLFKVYFESCAIFKRVHSSGKLDMSTWAGFLFIYRTPKWKTFFVCKSGMEGNSSAASATWKTFLVWTLVSKLLLRFTSSHLSHCHGHFKGKLPIRVELQTKVPEDYAKISQSWILWPFLSAY